MPYRAAVFSNGHVATGCHHGEAFCNLSYQDRLAQDLVSGHVNEDGTFTSELPHPDKNVILIRHAESRHNAKLTSDLDSDLTDRGHQQAERVAHFLYEMGLRGYFGFVSPLLRTLKTARYIEQATGLPFMVNELISEHSDYYPPEGLHIPCRQEDYDDFFWSDLCERKQLYYEREPNEQFINRLKIFFNKLPHNSVIVTHGSCVTTLIEIAMGVDVKEVPEWNEGVGNATVTLVKNGTLVWMSKDPAAQ